MSRLTFSREVQVLRQYAANARLGIVEIGVYDGGTTREMAQVASVPIYAIDPIIPDSMPPHGIGSADAVRQVVAEYPRIKFIQEYSYNTARNFDAPFDFIFVDGSHKFEDVRQDFIDWFPKLAPGGFIAFHDTAPVETGESAFKGWAGCICFAHIIECAGYPYFVERMDTLRIFRK